MTASSKSPRALAICAKLAPGATIAETNTQPALDLDALLGGLRPVLEGLDKTRSTRSATRVIELLQGRAGAVADAVQHQLFTTDLAARDQLIGDVINNLNTAPPVDDKGAQFDTSVDKLQQPITGLAQGPTRSPDRSLRPLASASADLTDMLTKAAARCRP